MKWLLCNIKQPGLKFYLRADENSILLGVQNFDFSIKGEDYSVLHPLEFADSQ
jgi:hypothetical protein